MLLLWIVILLGLKASAHYSLPWLHAGEFNKHTGKAASSDRISQNNRISLATVSKVYSSCTSCSEEEEEWRSRVWFKSQLGNECPV